MLRHGPGPNLGERAVLVLHANHLRADDAVAPVEVLGVHVHRSTFPFSTASSSSYKWQHVHIHIKANTQGKTTPQVFTQEAPPLELTGSFNSISPLPSMQTQIPPLSPGPFRKVHPVPCPCVFQLANP